MSDTRTYNSPLREQRAAETRERVLDGATRLLARGATALTIPAVAREAGVAVPTVYRHFPSKEALEDAVVAHVRAAAGVDRIPEGTGLPALEGRARDIINHLATQPRAMLAVLMAAFGRELLAAPPTNRVPGVVQMLGAELDGVEPDDARKYATILAVLFGTPGVAGLARLGVPPDEAVELLMWAARGLRTQLRDAPPEG